MNVYKIFSNISIAGVRRGRRGLSSAVTPEGQSESFFYRHRYLLSGLVLLNAGIGGYIFLENKKRAPDVIEVVEKVPDVVEDRTVVKETKSETLPSTKVVITPPTPPQISAEEQRQLYKWMLEEKRKIKATDPAEKKRIDEEKAMLKKLIRSKEIPNI
ncbi:uncharacterized protein LOC131038276 isoform X2 [Cryptomeria japonica]|uniref:uncharacterized protein LOC131038276 isoform X2 n=1 Tax=Cryptomeria japonica TaxID=3369 RepID=UPI0027D9F1B8|nr:uncharacterized protein LOC131038276 isoform X2 [Cryptomeria japonica]